MLHLKSILVLFWKGFGEPQKTPARGVLMRWENNHHFSGSVCLFENFQKEICIIVLNQSVFAFILHLMELIEIQ